MVRPSGSGRAYADPLRRGPGWPDPCRPAPGLPSRAGSGRSGARRAGCGAPGSAGAPQFRGQLGDGSAAAVVVVAVDGHHLGRDRDHQVPGRVPAAGANRWSTSAWVRQASGFHGSRAGLGRRAPSGDAYPAAGSPRRAGSSIRRSAGHPTPGPATGPLPDSGGRTRVAACSASTPQRSACAGGGPVAVPSSLGAWLAQSGRAAGLPRQRGGRAATARARAVDHGERLGRPVPPAELSGERLA